MISSALLYAGTTIKDEVDGVTIITPNGLHHTIKGTNLERVAVALRDEGYDFHYPDPTTLKIETVIPLAASSFPASASL